MERGMRIGYVGVDVLNNATVCNEAMGLLEAGVPLEVVSVYRHEKATFYQDATLEGLHRAIHSIYPLRPGRVLAALVAGPFLFGLRFWSMVAKAVFGPTEGVRDKLTVLYQMLPALLLAMRWRGGRVGHIHAHWAHTATSIAMHAAELLGVGFSFTGHANDLFVHRVALRDKVRRARFIVCISEYHRRFYLAMGAEAARLPVVYCGIDVDRLEREALSIRRGGRPRIVGVGRLVEKKGFDHLIAACSLLRADGEDFECVIAGSGPEHDRLARLIAHHGVEDVVRLTGRTVLQEDLPALLATARVFALPCVRDRDGDMDGLPQVLIEALACGVPAVSTRLVGIPDLVRDGENGILVEPGDVRGLALALARLLAFPEQATHLGEQGQAWVRDHFGRVETVRRLSGLFRWAAATPGSSAPATLPAAAPGSEDQYARRLFAEAAG